MSLRTSLFAVSPLFGCHLFFGGRLFVGATETSLSWYPQGAPSTRHTGELNILHPPVSTLLRSLERPQRDRRSRTCLALPARSDTPSLAVPSSGFPHSHPLHPRLGPFHVPSVSSLPLILPLSWSSLLSPSSPLLCLLVVNILCCAWCCIRLRFTKCCRWVSEQLRWSPGHRPKSTCSNATSSCVLAHAKPCCTNSIGRNNLD